LPPYTSYKLLEISENYTTSTGEKFKLFLKLECLGIAKKLVDVVVPAKEKKLQQLSEVLLLIQANSTVLIYENVITMFFRLFNL